MGRSQSINLLAFNNTYVYQRDGSQWFTVDSPNGDRTEGLRVNIFCGNTGSADGNFSLVVEFTNASFSNRTTQPYLQSDNSTVKFPFMLHQGELQSTDVYFNIDNDTTSFDVKISFESSQTRIYSTEAKYMGVDTMHFEWFEPKQYFYADQIV